MKFWKMVMVMSVVLGGAFVSCVGLQNRAAIERNLASENYGLGATLAQTEQFNMMTEDRYLNKIQPIFNNRCITCHSCFSAPCQLNLTSFAGVDRGAIQDNIYERRDIGNKSPTRLGVDVPQTYDWETITRRWREEKFVGSNGNHGFFSVLDRAQADPIKRMAASNLFQVLTMKQEYERTHSLSESISKHYSAVDSRMCPDNKKDGNALISEQMRNYLKHVPWAGMPYGFPALSPAESSEIYQWIKDGSQPPTSIAMLQLSRPSKPEVLKEWEDFLNAKDFKHRITARYLYEHLFIGHLYFDDMPGEFYRLIRAYCEENGSNCHELPTRRPSDDPKTSDYFYDHPHMKILYKFQKVTATVVHKAHIPYQLNSAKLAKWKSMFIDQISEGKKNFPAYGNEAGGNPFITFKDIPAKSRYQFLLDDSYFFINTFIKGPVCWGSEALSVIDDHFWVFFIKPESDVTVQHPEFFNDAGELLSVPAADGNDWTFTELFKQRRRSARMIKKDYLNKYMKSGFALSDIWNGDGFNPNSILTVYRHIDSASVSRGAVGEIPKTMWMLDYPIFEDIYYNLVAEYDVFAPIVHAARTRLHMDASRFNAQDMYLAFMPAPLRAPTRLQFSRDPSHVMTTKDTNCKVLPAELCAFYSQSAGVMRDVVYPYSGPEVSSQIDLKDREFPQGELAEKILQYMPAKVTEFTSDKINIRNPNGAHPNPYTFSSRKDLKMSEVEDVMATIGGRKGYFASFLPEISYVQVIDEDNKNVKWYSMLHNRERYNVSFLEMLVPEKEKLWPEMDSVNFVRGFVGSYANAIYSVPVKRFPEFILAVFSLRDNGPTFQALNKNFLVSRHNPNFWKYFDNMNYYAKQQGITPYSDKYEGAVTDLNRYINDVGF